MLHSFLDCRKNILEGGWCPAQKACQRLRQGFAQLVHEVRSQRHCLPHWSFLGTWDANKQGDVPPLLSQTLPAETRHLQGSATRSIFEMRGDASWIGLVSRSVDGGAYHQICEMVLRQVLRMPSLPVFVDEAADLSDLDALFRFLSKDESCNDGSLLHIDLFAFRHIL